MKFLESHQPQSEGIALIWDFVAVRIIRIMPEKRKGNQILGRADREREEFSTSSCDQAF